MKTFAAKVVSVLLKPELRPFEIRVARAAGLAVLGFLGVKYGTKV